MSLVALSISLFLLLASITNAKFSIVSMFVFAYLKYYLKKDRLVKKENWQLLVAEPKEDFCETKIRDISRNKEKFYSLYIPKPRCEDLRKEIK